SLVEILLRHVPPSRRPCLRLSTAGGRGSRLLRPKCALVLAIASSPLPGLPSSVSYCWCGSPFQIRAARQVSFHRITLLCVLRFRRFASGRHERRGGTGKSHQGSCHASRQKQERSVVLKSLSSTRGEIRVGRDRYPWLHLSNRQ